MEFAANSGNHRYDELARFLALPAKDAREGAASLVHAVLNLEKSIGSPTALCEMKVERADFQSAMETMLDHAQNDTQIVASPRVPEREELEKLFWYAYEGKGVDF
jgi:acetaldehyde dehydrogenase/alcohol dehydrogenase